MAIRPRLVEIMKRRLEKIINPEESKVDFNEYCTESIMQGEKIAQVPSNDDPIKAKILDE